MDINRFHSYRFRCDQTDCSILLTYPQIMVDWFLCEGVLASELARFLLRFAWHLTSVTWAVLDRPNQLRLSPAGDEDVRAFIHFCLQASLEIGPRWHQSFRSSSTRLTINAPSSKEMMRVATLLASTSRLISCRSIPVLVIELRRSRHSRSTGDRFVAQSQQQANAAACTLQ
jgi:hypothetical protein